MFHQFPGEGEANAKQIKTQKENMKIPAQPGMKILPEANATKLNDYKRSLRNKQIISDHRKTKMTSSFLNYSNATAMITQGQPT